MIDATTHTRKIWRSHFDGADSTQKKIKEFVKIAIAGKCNRGDNER
jgi:hypothetical protein